MRKLLSNSHISYALTICFILSVVLYSGGNTVSAAANPVMAKNKIKANALVSYVKNGQAKSGLVGAASLEIKSMPAVKTAEIKKFDQLAAPEKGDQIAVVKTKLGVIRIRLFPNYAPKAVEIFVNRANTGFYDGLSFNKVLGNSIIQGGTDTQNTTISTGTNYNFDDYNPDVRNYKGAVSIASGDSGSIDQFMIVQAGPAKISRDTVSFMKSSGEVQFPKQVINKYQRVGGAPWLDYHNVIFGQVYAGMDVVDKISRSAVDENNRIKKDIKIIKVTIEVKK